METSGRKILPVIVGAQFSCTSLWFACNAVIGELGEAFFLGPSALGHLTSAVQFGFISGTLLFALLGIADRYSPSLVFFVCAIGGAVTNLGVLIPGHQLASLMSLRIATGVFLAGIYPVGMKIAADYHEKGLGKALGYLVGALVLGTAFPHLIKSLTTSLPWQSVFVFTSVFSALGGLLLFLLVPDGPYRRKSASLDLSAIFKVFRRKEFRSAAFGYFGHMWELYAFWAFVPLMLHHFQRLNKLEELPVPLLSFLIIAAGSFACVIGGYAALKTGSKPTATIALFVSGICCAFSPISFSLSIWFFVAFLLIWSLFVIADSPQFSTLVAQSAPRENTATALTIVNCIGFSITILSIELLSLLYRQLDIRWLFLFLLPGPVFGLYFLIRKRRPEIHP